MKIENEILLGDCGSVLKEVPDSLYQLIMTSPPYADQRKNTYGGIHPDKYVGWFEPIAKELHRVLKPNGTFILNIKEKVVNGERSTYVIDLIKMMREHGWLWTEEFIWCKKNSFPGKWKNRFRDSWERCLHFNKQRDFLMNQESVMVPIGDWAKTRLAHLSDTDKVRDNSKVGSGFGKNVSNWVGKEKVYPTNVLHLEDDIIQDLILDERDMGNIPCLLLDYLIKSHPEIKVQVEPPMMENVLHLATECGNKNHSAAFPISLPTWFIKLFTNPGDYVLDPFMGSGTTAVAAVRLGRVYTGIELDKEYISIAESRISQATVNDVELAEEAAAKKVKAKKEKAKAKAKEKAKKLPIKSKPKDEKKKLAS